MNKSKVYKTVAVCLALILAMSTSYYVGAYTATSPVFAPLTQLETASFVIHREGSFYYAKNGQTGAPDYSGTNFTAVGESCIDNLPTRGGKIVLKTAEYEGWIVIDRDGVILEGEGAYNDIPVGIPDNSPTALYGTVLKVTTADKDGIRITGQRYGVVIRDLGIWFTQSSTGCGITASNGVNYGITHSTIENIKVLNCDKDSYAVELYSFLHCNIMAIMAWGGPALHLYANTDSFHAGNSIVDNVYNYVKYDLSPVTLAGGPYPIFIHKNDALSDNYINLMDMRRIQVNDPTTQPDADYFSFVSFNLRYSTISELDIEGVNNNSIKLGSNFHVTFVTAYTWALDPADAYLVVSSDNAQVTFINSALERVLDSNHTDRYINCNVASEIVAGTLAEFIGLHNNTGYAILTSGQSSIQIDAAWIGSNSMIFLTIVEADDLANGEALKVDSIDSANNNFNVECMDGGTASIDIGFFWEVSGSQQ